MSQARWTVKCLRHRESSIPVGHSKHGAEKKWVLYLFNIYRGVERKEGGGEIS